MKRSKMDAHRYAVISLANPSIFFEALKARGDCLVGAAVRDRAIIHDQTKAIDGFERKPGVRACEAMNSL